MQNHAFVGPAPDARPSGLLVDIATHRTTRSLARYGSLRIALRGPRAKRSEPVTTSGLQ